MQHQLAVAREHGAAPVRVQLGRAADAAAGGAGRRARARGGALRRRPHPRAALLLVPLPGRRLPDRGNLIGGPRTRLSDFHVNQGRT